MALQCQTWEGGFGPNVLSQNPIDTPSSPPVLLMGEAESSWVGGWQLAKVKGPCTTPSLFHTGSWVHHAGRGEGVRGQRGCVTQCHGRGRQRALRRGVARHVARGERGREDLLLPG